ncbi:MAG: heme ABC exporter ATP-binding protein CcmA [Clostridia bacterium]|nr:heme ABC exporter ATP-binding protein CcmA [Clostridia bacterium]
MSEPVALEVDHLSKRYGKSMVLRAITFRVAVGEAVAILGPNGSGKTTLLRCLAGLLRPNHGRIRVFGYDLHQEELKAKQALAFVPDTPSPFQELTVFEHLKFVALACGLDQADFKSKAQRLLELYGLDQHQALPFQLSRGMAQKLAICCALIRPWKLMLLDEPTANLDRQAFDILKATLAEAAGQGKSVLLSTHQAALAEEVCTRFLILSGGEIKFSGSARELRRAAGVGPEVDLGVAYRALLTEPQQYEDDNDSGEE